MDETEYVMEAILRVLKYTNIKFCDFDAVDQYEMLNGVFEVFDNFSDTFMSESINKAVTKELNGRFKVALQEFRKIDHRQEVKIRKLQKELTKQMKEKCALLNRKRETERATRKVKKWTAR